MIGISKREIYSSLKNSFHNLIMQLNQRKTKESFSQEEDNRIAKFEETHGIEKISELIPQLPNRTARQIRERYRLYLDPSVLKTPFEYEEDMKLLQYVKEIGKKWSKIAKLIKGRTDVQLKYK
jgi:hypothetical protein